MIKVSVLGYFNKISALGIDKMTTKTIDIIRFYSLVWALEASGDYSQSILCVA